MPVSHVWKKEKNGEEGRFLFIKQEWERKTKPQGATVLGNQWVWANTLPEDFRIPFEKFSPGASSSSSLKTLLSSLSSWDDFLPSPTGTTVKFVGIFSPCASSQHVLYSLSLPFAPPLQSCLFALLSFLPLFPCAGLPELWFEVLGFTPTA